jgi:hypothetical protein
MVFGFIPECRSASFRNERSPSPESPKSHEIHSVRYAGFSGKKNGELLRLAEEAGYGAFLTVDQGIPYQRCDSAGLP